MITLQDAAALASHESGLVVISTLRSNGTIQSSVVNAGVLAHPATGEAVLGLVTAGAVKLANLRARPQLTATFRNGWQWAAVEGLAELAGPDDPQPWLDADAATDASSRDLRCRRRRARQLGGVRPGHGRGATRRRSGSGPTGSTATDSPPGARPTGAAAVSRLPNRPSSAPAAA